MEFLISKTSDSRLDTTDFTSEMEAFPFEESPLSESNEFLRWIVFGVSTRWGGSLAFAAFLLDFPFFITSAKWHTSSKTENSFQIDSQRFLRSLWIYFLNSLTKPGSDRIRSNPQTLSITFGHLMEYRGLIQSGPIQVLFVPRLDFLD